MEALAAVDAHKLFLIVQCTGVGNNDREKDVGFFLRSKQMIFTSGALNRPVPGYSSTG